MAGTRSKSKEKQTAKVTTATGDSKVAIMTLEKGTFVMVAKVCDVVKKCKREKREFSVMYVQSGITQCVRI